MNDNTQIAGQITEFLQEIFKKTQKSKAVIGVSGGIDSALSLTLLCQSLGSSTVYPLLLPYGEQSIEDARTICKWNQVPEENLLIINIKPFVDGLIETLHIDVNELTRRGNIMARMRMICLFDRAKTIDGLVCGTENKSEHYLGYFTRFGDAASDIEPIATLYKTQVCKLAKHLQIPEIFLSKEPSAGLWEDQTDTKEMGFTYEEADEVLAHDLDGVNELNVNPAIIERVRAQITSQAFKHKVPYSMNIV